MENVTLDQPIRKSLTSLCITLALAALSLAGLLWAGAIGAPPGASSPAYHESSLLSSGSVITIGATVPLTGATADVGEAMRVGLEIAADEINAAGGLLGVPVHLVVSDTAAMPELGADSMDYFAQIGAVGVVGEYHSAVGLTMTQKAHGHHIPTIFAETWADEITALGYPEVFRISPTYSMFAELPARYVDELGFDSVAIVADDTWWGQFQASILESALSANGVGYQTFTATVGTVDFTAVIADIEPLNPQAIIVLLSGGDDPFNFEQQTAEAGLAPSADTICVDGEKASYSDDFWEKVPNGNYTVFRHLGPVPGTYTDHTGTFETEYLSRTGKSWAEYYAIAAYDSLVIMADAIRRAGSTDPDAVIAAIETTDLVGALGHYYFPYGSANPVPGDVPAYMWHQWPEPQVLLSQYYEVDQNRDEAAVVYPAVYRTHGIKLIPYGGFRAYLPLISRNPGVQADME